MKGGGEGQTSPKVIKAPEGIPINLIDLIQKTKKFNNKYLYFTDAIKCIISPNTHPIKPYF